MFDYVMSNDMGVFECEDYSFSVRRPLVYVNDGAEGCMHCMSISQITEAMVDVILEDEDDATNPMANFAARQYVAYVMSKATDIGLANFVRNYCEV